MVNCNPETVSTDYDTSDRLYFEPLTEEDVLNVLAAETAASGGVAAPGDRGARRPDPAQAERPAAPGADRRHQPGRHRPGRGPGAWNARVRAPRHPAAARRHRGLAGGGAGRRPTGSGFPVLVRPSYVLGGRAMQICYDAGHLKDAMAGLFGSGCSASAAWAGRAVCRPSGPVLIDRFLEDAIEVDVDAIRDATGEVLIGGVMEHVEEAGVHSGDSACAIPPPDAAAVAGRRDRGLHAGDRRRPRRPGPDQRAVRGAGQGGLRHRGQPAGQPAPCPSWPRPPGCRWPRWRPG